MEVHILRHVYRLLPIKCVSTIDKTLPRYRRYMTQLSTPSSSVVSLPISESVDDDHLSTGTAEGLGLNIFAFETRSVPFKSAP